MESYPTPVGECLNKFMVAGSTAGITNDQALELFQTTDRKDNLKGYNALSYEKTYENEYGD